MSALIHFPSHSDPALYSRCVCLLSVRTLGGQHVYCSTLLCFTLFFQRDWRSLTQEILIDLSAHKSLVCVPVYLCVWVYMCCLSNIVLCVKEVKDQILLSISILDNKKTLSCDHSHKTSHSRTFTHFIPSFISVACYVVTRHLFNNLSQNEHTNTIFYITGSFLNLELVNAFTNTNNNNQYISLQYVLIFVNGS